VKRHRLDVWQHHFAHQRGGRGCRCLDWGRRERIRLGGQGLYFNLNGELLRLELVLLLLMMVVVRCFGGQHRGAWLNLEESWIEHEGLWLRLRLRLRLCLEVELLLLL